VTTSVPGRFGRSVADLARARRRSDGPRRGTARSARSRVPSCRPPRSERRAAPVARRAGLLLAPQEEREELHRLAEAHVVGEARAETERAHGDEPVEPALLIGAKRRQEGEVRRAPPAPPVRRRSTSSATTPEAVTATDSPSCRTSPASTAWMASRAVSFDAPAAEAYWMSPSSRGSIATHAPRNWTSGALCFASAASSRASGARRR
jgi:hypothetical protein